MSNSILLSIVIPSHNSQSTINNLLLSINEGKFDHFKNIETVIIDDCSKDQTITIIKDLIPKLKFACKLIILDKNLGPAKARNLGVKKSQGKYILFLDADVVLFKKTLANVFNEISQKKFKAFTGIWHYRQKTKKFFPQFKALRDWAYWFIEREKNFRYYLFSTRIACIEKNLFNQIGGFNTSYQEATVEDIELTYRIEQKERIKFCPKWKIFHEFEDFWPIATKYFKRSRDWVGLYQDRLKFDPVATSKSEAFKSIVAGFIILLLFFSFIQSSFFYPLIILIVVFIFLELKFWSFIIKKKGVVFLLKTVFTSIVLYLIIDTGSLYGLIKSLIASNRS